MAMLLSIWQIYPHKHCFLDLKVSETNDGGRSALHVLDVVGKQCEKAPWSVGIQTSTGSAAPTACSEFNRHA